MRRLFTMMSEQVQVTGHQLQTWWATLSPDPSTWLPFTWVLAGIVLVIVLALLLRPRRRAGPRRPELLISHGELRVTGPSAADATSSLQAPDDAEYELGMTVSNLSASPVQLLELAVHTNRASAATTAEVAAVLPPHGAVDVAAELQDAAGDEGVLDLFVYVPDMPPKTFRVRARLRWEPWNARYRVLPLDQRVDAARGLGERAQRRRPAAAWQRAGNGPAGAAGSRRSGAPAFTDEGRFEPRAEFSRPRSAAPAGREQAAFEWAGAERPGPEQPRPERWAQERWAPEGDAPEGLLPERPRPGRPGVPPDDAPLPDAPWRGTRAPSDRGARDEQEAGHPREALLGSGDDPRARVPDAQPDERPGGRGRPPAEEPWPPRRPSREARRAEPREPEPREPEPRRAEPRQPEPAPVPPRRQEERGRDAARSSAEEPVAGRAGQERTDRDDGTEARAWRLGDGERFREGEAAQRSDAGAAPSQRSGLGRAARAARGTERDGPRGAEGTEPEPRRGGSGARARARRWAVRADAPQRGADLGPGELVGPDEDAPPATTSGEADVEERREERHEERPEEREHTSRPRLEFPDEF